MDDQNEDKKLDFPVWSITLSIVVMLLCIVSCAVIRYDMVSILLLGLVIPLTLTTMSLGIWMWSVKVTERFKEISKRIRELEQSRDK